MLEIDGKIISLEVLEKKFCCNPEICLGNCCVQGDFGAPLEGNEATLIEECYPVFKKYLTPLSVRMIEKLGFSIPDRDNEPTTPLVNGEECVFVYYENDIAKCAIEKAFFEDKTTFRKPISCHLYPIRIKNYKDFEAVNYHNWHICHSALLNGDDNGVKLVDFLKDALIRKYGEDWYNALKYASEQLPQQFK
ncbi:MAG: DUF3109 domain-containing protein [Bacteroidetes bacterium HGW-Bacteroidetes-21]|nr:MAG: DUF3109 domain-containing protein [Bacteroidetes bacterium HGW-Bacteroidetes-21]